MLFVKRERTNAKKIIKKKLPEDASELIIFAYNMEKKEAQQRLRELKWVNENNVSLWVRRELKKLNERINFKAKKDYLKYRKLEEEITKKLKDMNAL